MAKVPTFLFNALNDIPEVALEKVFKSLKVTEKDVFKKHLAAHATSKTIYKDFVLSLFGCDRAVVASLYATVEGVLFVGGCAPGIGIAFNLIDACFCFILGNWLGCFVAIISCFPIPGFKIAGKGLEKFFVAILHKISPQQLLSLTKKIGIRLSRIGFHADKSYMMIREQIEKMIPEIHNPFVETIIRELSNIIKKYPVATSKMSNSVCKTGKELTDIYTIQSKQVGKSFSPQTVHEGTQIVRRYQIMPDATGNIPKYNQYSHLGY